MKKIYTLLVAVITLIVVSATVYFWGQLKSEKELTIYEGIQSQIGDLRIGVESIGEQTENADAEDDSAQELGNTSASGPVAKLFIYDFDSDSRLSVFIGDRYPFGKYEIRVEDIFVETEESQGYIVLSVSSDEDKDLIIIENILTIPSKADTEEKIFAYGSSFLNATYGVPKEDWNILSGERVVIMNRVYDKLVLELSGGDEEVVHFDVTNALREITKSKINDLGNIVFSNNSGSSIEDAIIIKGAEGEKDGVASEYVYLEAMYGLRDIDWQLVIQKLLNSDDRDYDEMDIRLSDGTEKTIYFDITDFFGKNNF